jgi:ribosomal protein L21E
MKTAFQPGVRVRPKCGGFHIGAPVLGEVGTIVRYDGECFYIVEVTRAGERKRLVVLEDDLEVA